MEIEKAIKRLSNVPSMQDPGGVVEFFVAVKLGTEALKRLKEHREDHIDITFRALPGETEPKPSE